MKFIWFLVSSIITIGLIVVFNTTWLLPAPLGKLLSPQHGVWQNAKPANEDFNADLSFPSLKGKTDVYIDERLVPHVFGEYDDDVFFVQGYLHAKFRLWQMEFQARAAGGRLSEVLGDKAGTTDILNLADRYFRRLGMTYAAEKSLALMEKDSATHAMVDAYTAGVNAYISSMKESDIPLEYKLLGYDPEPWTNLKIGLFLKYMSYELAGGETDFEFTNAKNAFTKAVFDKMYPLQQDSADPVVSRGTPFDPPAFRPVAPASADSLYFTYKQSGGELPQEPQKPEPSNGSNNWAVSGAKTKSHYPILCNDPHLGLNLPSLWFEMQLSTPNFNAYGASFPSAPCVIIGFNDSCAFGFTNSGRDVKDYYTIQFRDESKREYLLNGRYEKTVFRIERYKMRNKPDFVDTVAYTVFGPVIFDEKYLARNKDGKCYAVRWKAHDSSNDLKAFYDLDRSRNYLDYVRAARNLHTPGQNIVFAAKNGDIAIRAQGEFPAKWKRQGDFVMPGTDTSYMWQGMIPQAENPRMYNPPRGFVSSANQVPADSTYPYYLGGSFPFYRGLIINRRLSQMQNITPQDMMKLQTDNYNVFAEFARPLLLHAVDESRLSSDEKKYWDMLKSWNLVNNPDETGATVFSVVFDSLRTVIWNDELSPLKYYTTPTESTLVEALMKDTAYQFVDNINTPQKETLHDDVLLALQKALPVLQKAEAGNRLKWAAFKDTRITHLTRSVPALSRLHINTGGSTYSINATKATHGPSWRMVVHLSPVTEAYGVYPGGQDGNPGSRYYDNYIDTWAKGEYYPLVVMKKGESDKSVKWKMTFSNP